MLLAAELNEVAEGDLGFAVAPVVTGSSGAVHHVSGEADLISVAVGLVDSLRRGGVLLSLVVCGVKSDRKIAPIVLGDKSKNLMKVLIYECE